MDENFEYLCHEYFGPWLEKQMDFPHIPDTFRSLGSPWRVSDGLSQSETINKVLERSFEVQASRFDSSTHFYSEASSHFPEDYVCTMNRQCIETSGLLQYYFSWLDVDAKVFCGTMLRPGQFFKDFGNFHTFLEIEGEIIDNTYSCQKVRLYDEFYFKTSAFFKKKAVLCLCVRNVIRPDQPVK